MQVIRQIKTFDGKVHDDIDAAVRHLNKLHADALSKIAIEITRLDNKYVAIGDWIDANLGRFLDLHEIKQDMKIDKPDEED